MKKAPDDKPDSVRGYNLSDAVPCWRRREAIL
jgi:hypothetical protein